MNKEELYDLTKDMYEGFEIKCKKCGSKQVIVENDMGFSDSSGGWGGLHLVCVDCDSSVTIYDNC